MTAEIDKPEWCSVSKLEIVEPDPKLAYIFSNGRNRITVSVRIVPVTKDYTIIKREDLSDEEVQQRITLIDAIDETELPLDVHTEWTTDKIIWGYTHNVNPEDPQNRFVNTPDGVGMLLSERANEGERIIKFNVYCRVTGGDVPKKKIAIKVSLHNGDVFTSNGPAATGSAYISLFTLLHKEYKDYDIKPYYYDFVKAKDDCNDGASLYRVVELSLNSEKYRLVASQIFNNEKEQYEINSLKKAFFDNESEYPWIHRAVLSPKGAFSYYCWGFDHIPEKANVDNDSNDIQPPLGRGLHHCYVRINKVFTSHQKKFLVIIIWQKKSGGTESVILDKPINVRVYDQFGNQGEFKLSMGEDLCVKNQSTSAGVKLDPFQIE